MWVDLVIPSGVRASGTERGSRGAWLDASLVRWDPDLQPIGGWVAKSVSTVTGKGRAILTWRDNAGSTWTAIGTNSGLYVMTPSGYITDITPSGFTAGRADALVGGGYGSGLYGSGDYGDPIASSSQVSPASVWTLALWNDRLVGCMSDDGKIYQWDLNPLFVAEVIEGAPEDCSGIVVTEDAILMAFSNRSAIWSNQGDNTDWIPTSLNQAGELALNTDGVIMCGRKVKGQMLVFTTEDLWVATYQGLPAVYGFQKAGDSCGPVSKGSPVAYGTGNCVWMSSNSFYLFNGFTQPVPCAVQDKVFSDINLHQISKVSGWHNSQFNEVWWHYPSSGSTENDRYVSWNYASNDWNVGSLARLCGDGSDAPYLMTSDGYVYSHETGEAYGGAYPYAKTGPFEWPGEMGQGAKRVQIAGLIPDEKTQGQSRVTFYLREFPNLTETTKGPYTISGAPVDFLWQARQVEMKVEFLDGDARWGLPRIDAKPVSSR